MKSLDIISRRLHNQRLVGKKFNTPEEVVDWFGAIQAQEYAPAKWALGKRINNASDEKIDKAFNEGRFLRTHVMRPTWHFVMPGDIRWMLKLTAPRVNQVLGYYNRKSGLNDKVFVRSNDIITKTLRGGKHLTRTEIVNELKKSKIATDDLQRSGHLMGRAELDAVICSGPRRGRQFTYALLEERVPKTKNLDRDESLAKLTWKYFRSHGPATLQDLVWWSGLTTADARAGLEMNKSKLMNEEVDGKTYWFTNTISLGKIPSPTAYLMSVYDEYTIAYKDRSALFDPRFEIKVGNAIFNLVLVIDGRVAGMWKRTFKKDTVDITVNPYDKLNKAEKLAVTQAAENYSKFLNMKVKLKIN